MQNRMCFRIWALLACTGEDALDRGSAVRLWFEHRSVWGKREGEISRGWGDEELDLPTMLRVPAGMQEILVGVAVEMDESNIECADGAWKKGGNVYVDIPI